MREVLPDLLRWWRAGETVGVAMVVAVAGSAPREPGAVLVAGPDGSAVGSVSGGCVEGAAHGLADEVRAGAAPRVERFGISDSDAFAVGLTCGGVLDVLGWRLSPAGFPDFEVFAGSVAAGEPVALATVVAGDRAVVGRQLVVWPDRRSGSLGSARRDDAVADDARGLLAAGRTATVTYGPQGQRRGVGLSVFVASFAPPPRMLVFGAIDHAAALARVGRFLGYRVTVCDARPLFATSRRLPDADEVVVDWPHRYLQGQVAAGAVDGRTVVCVLTHEPRFDVPVLAVALAQDVAFVGAMGSRRTHLDRLQRLREAGVSEDRLARLSSPIGLDLGARTPEETAVSIAAEIVARRWNGTGLPLTHRDGPVHHPGTPDGADRPQGSGQTRSSSTTGMVREVLRS
ncbi:XdhC family protein [Nakamurella endophytica]|uniref:XdhC family protein n=1 Tax=Nakamurella endophytica TaxID=1748367 RepID=UPI0016684A14|nr:XdhC/CoxI family protein [Nakamurella endophytica]